MKTKITPTKDDLIDVVLWAIIATFLLVLMFQCTPTYGQTQQINLKPGWQMISSYIIPDEPNIDSIFKGLPVDVVVSMDGVYWPSGNVNTINNWQPGKAYKVKMSAAARLVISGQPIPDTCIQYHTGPNFMPVTVGKEKAVAEIMKGNEAKILFLVNMETMGLYYPFFGIDTIKKIEPGKGYLLFNLNTFTLCQQ